jgi:hypothetical protein
VQGTIYGVRGTALETVSVRVNGEDPDGYVVELVERLD